MAKTEKRTPPAVCEEDGRRHGRWLYLLFLLFIVALISSGITGYLLGLKASPVAGGQLIDTILLAPENGPESEVSTILHLTGQVIYSDGTPASYRTLELHSDPVRTVTDSTGNFLFHHVPLGEHSISIINEDGSVAARREIVLDRNQTISGIVIQPQDSGVYVVELALDVRMLELAIELDDETYYINPEHITYETMDGTVVTPAGSASVQEGPVVTPAGNICLPDGTIVLPGKDATIPVAVILPDDTVVYPDAPLNAGGIIVTPDGTVTLPDGTKVLPGGEIQRPDGQTTVPGKSGVIVTESEVIPIGQTGRTEETGEMTETSSQDAAQEKKEEETLPVSGERQENTDSTEGNTVPPNGGSDNSAQGGNGSQGESTGGGNGGQGGSSDGGNDSTGGGSVDRGILEVAGQVKDTAQYVSWRQESKIDLFYNRDYPERSIRPGSKGYYLFRLKNTRREALTVTMAIAEGGNHLPLMFTLTPISAGKPGHSVSGSLEGYQSSLELKTAVDADSETEYMLEWEWPSNGHDKEDTEAGKRGGDYMLTLTIYAEGGVR